MLSNVMRCFILCSIKILTDEKRNNVIGAIGAIFTLLFFSSYCADDAYGTLLLNVVSKMRNDLKPHSLDKLPMTQKNKSYETKMYNHFDAKFYLRIEEAYKFAYGFIDVPLAFENKKRQGLRCNHTSTMLAFLSYNIMLHEMPVSQKSKENLLSLLKVYKKHVSDTYKELDPYTCFRRYAVFIKGLKVLNNKKRAFDWYLESRKSAYTLRENLAQYEAEIDKISILIQSKKTCEEHGKFSEEKIDKAITLRRVEKVQEAGHKKHKEFSEEKVDKTLALRRVEKVQETGYKKREKSSEEKAGKTSALRRVGKACKAIHRKHKERKKTKDKKHSKPICVAS